MLHVSVEHLLVAPVLMTVTAATMTMTASWSVTTAGLSKQDL